MQTSTPASEPLTGPAMSDTNSTATALSSPLQSTDLFKGQKSVVIEHNGASYCLQTTKLGKLILTK